MVNLKQFKHPVNILVNPATNDIRMGMDRHAMMVSAGSYDDYVKCTYHPDKDLMVFRFFDRGKSIEFKSEMDVKRSHFICESAFRELVRQGYVNYKTDVEFIE